MNKITRGRGERTGNLARSSKPRDPGTKVVVNKP